LGRGKTLNRAQARHAFASYRRRRRRVLLGGVCALVVAVALGCAPAAAKTKARHKPAHQETEHVSKEPFGDIPKGPLQIFISINQQKLHLYSDGTHVADAPVATGVPSLPTPLGVFSVISKDRFHRSNIYSNAPMPYMQRITWSGVALHEGENIGHPASHGCIRMPHDFAARLWVLTKLGVRVIIARSELKPVVFADSHLFVHKDMPPAPPAPPAAAAEPVKTAQTTDSGKTTDAAESLNTEAPTAADAAGPANAAALQPAEPVKPAVATPTETAKLRGSAADPPPPLVAPEQIVPVPLAKPAALAEVAAAARAPIAIFVSRKEKKLYVRQHFTPLFDALIAVEHPEQALGTHVFTAMEYLDDGSTFRWNVVSLPGEPPKAARNSDNDGRSARHGKGKRREQALDKPIADPPQPPPQTPAEALARLEIPQDVIDRISELVVPGSSLVVSDQGLGEETGEGTDFIVITH